MASRPPWWHERAAARRDLLAEGVDRLRATLGSFSGVKGALVFGSYARGESGPDSDLDIILVRETELAPHRRDDDVRASLRLGVPYDLVTLTPVQFERLPRESGFYAQALREGVWLDAT